METPSKGLSRSHVVSHIVLACLLALLGLLAVPGFCYTPRASNERGAPAMLKTLAAAEANFRANDRDGNKVQDFWTGDVSGLWSEGGGGVPAQLISRATAEADARPLKPLVKTPVPWAGYLFVVLKRDDSTGETYQTDTDGSGRKVRHTSKFGFCAYPAEYGRTGRLTFFMNENNTIFKQDTGGKPLSAWPADETLKAHWEKVD